MKNVSSSNSQAVNVPKLRFPGFSDEWTKEKLRDFTERVTRKNKDNETELPLTISSKDGLVDQVTYFNKQVSSKDMSGYYLLKNGEFAYNKSYSVGFDYGSIKRLDRYPMGALSTLYICFALTKHNSDFMKTYFDSLKWYKEIYMIAAEGARNHGLLNVPTEDFFDTVHVLPQSKSEQKKIAEFLLLLEDRIIKQEQFVNNLKLYKRGVLNHIFQDTSDWKSSTIRECLNYEQPQKYIVHSEKYDNNYTTPVLTANKAFILGYTNETDGVYNKGAVIIYDDFTMDTKFVDFDFKVKSSTIKMLTPKQGIDLYFMFNYFQFLSLKPEGHQRSYISIVEPMEIAIPYYEEQKRISSLCKKLDKEVSCAEALLNACIAFKSGLLQQMFI